MSKNLATEVQQWHLSWKISKNRNRKCDCITSGLMKSKKLTIVKLEGKAILKMIPYRRWKGWFLFIVLPQFTEDNGGGGGGEQDWCKYNWKY